MYGECTDGICGMLPQRMSYARICTDCLRCSVENLLLEADELGLGAVWLGIAPLRDRMDKVREVISIPEELEAFAIIPCGYPVQIKNQQNHYEKERVHFVE